MMSVFEAIQQRRSIRSFRPDPIPQEYILEMLTAARLAPSGGNRQPWRFFVVTEPEEKKALSQMAKGQKFVEEAPVVFVCAANLEAYSSTSSLLRFQEFADAGVLNTLSGHFATPEGLKEAANRPPPERNTLIRTAMANTYIAVEHLVLTATALGLGSCWVGAEGRSDEIRAIFNLPENILIVALVPVGYPAKVPPPRPRLSLEEILLRPLPSILPFSVATKASTKS